LNDAIDEVICTLRIGDRNCPILGERPAEYEEVRNFNEQKTKDSVGDHDLNK